MTQRILIYGFNAYTGTLNREKTHVTLAKLLKTAYTDLGYEVHVGFPPAGLSEESIKAYDKVFVGLASPNSIVSDRTYIASYMLGHLWGTGKLVLFFDDPDIRKFFYGVANILQDPTPDNVFRPVFKKRKLWYDPVVYPGDAARWADWHTNVLRALILDSAEEYPPVLIPTFPWFDMPRFGANIPGAMRDSLVQLDPTSMLGVPPIPDDGSVERKREWVVESIRTVEMDSRAPSESISHANSPRRQLWLQYQHTSFPVTSIPNKTPDADRVLAYQRAWGTLLSPMPMTSIGWWSKDMTYAIKSDTLFITDPSQVSELGPSFNLLAASTEHLTMEERDALAAEQKEMFLKMTWSGEQLKTAFEELI